MEDAAWQDSQDSQDSTTDEDDDAEGTEDEDDDADGDDRKAAAAAAPQAAVRELSRRLRFSGGFVACDAARRLDRAVRTAPLLCRRVVLLTSATRSGSRQG